MAPTDPDDYLLSYPDCDILNGDINGDGVTGWADLKPFVAVISNGGVGAGGLRTEYAWDGENRLIGVTPVAPLEGSQRAEFVCDYLGRRVEKRVYNWNVDDPNNPHWDAAPAVKRRYVWDGWRLVLEMDGAARSCGSSPGA
jgi:hypothetical protein